MYCLSRSNRNTFRIVLYLIKWDVHVVHKYVHYNKSAWRNLMSRLLGTWLVQIILRSMHHQTSPSKNLARDLRIRGSPGFQLGCVKFSVFSWDVQRSLVTVVPLSMPHLLLLPNTQTVNGGNCVNVRMCVGFISVACPSFSLSLPPPPLPV